VTTFDFSARCRLGDFRLDAEFQVDGRIVGLFGPSGSGKSTILRLIAGLLRPDSGRISVAGTAVFDSRTGLDLPAPKRRVWLVFQDGLLFPHLNVRQNLLYGAWARRKRWAPSEFARTIEILGIAQLLDRAPRHLSGGERQRVAIGRAILSDPAVLLMDEPVTAVDQERRLEILPHLEALARHAEVPILYVSHAMAEVERLADRIVFLRDGRVTEIT
jgi:molybdate transport system ATP-binding protein